MLCAVGRLWADKDTVAEMSAAHKQHSKETASSWGGQGQG